jgi:hypothetical protein
MSKFISIIALSIGLVGFGISPAQAVNELLVANTSGYKVLLNYNTPVPSGSAGWTALDASVVGPADSRIDIIDTHRKCGNDAWTIAFKFYNGKKMYHRGTQCVVIRPHLDLGAIVGGVAGVARGMFGCVALHLSPKGARWAQIPVAHCSEAWWKQHGEDATRLIIDAVSAAPK